MKNLVNKEIQRQITAPLREAMKSLNVDEQSVLTIWKEILDSSPQDSNRLRAVELFVKWMGLSMPDKVEINEVNIGVETPDDLDI